MSERYDSVMSDLTLCDDVSSDDSGVFDEYNATDVSSEVTVGWLFSPRGQQRRCVRCLCRTMWISSDKSVYTSALSDV